MNPTSNLRIMPTQEELRILREKLNNVKDLFIFNNPSKSLNNFGNSKNGFLNNTNEFKIDPSRVSQTSKFSGNNFNNNNLNLEENENFKGKQTGYSNLFSSSMQLPEKELELLNQRYYELQKYVDINKDKVEKIEKYDELLKEYEELKNELKKNKALAGNVTFVEILKDYTKMKSDFILLSNKTEENEKYIYQLEKQNKIFRDIENNTVNKNYLKLFIISLLNGDSGTKIFEQKENLKILSELFTSSGSSTNNNYLQFLSQRIDQLEFQNFRLINKIDIMTQNATNHLNELIEFSEVIADIKNVLNQVYESQSLTTEFLIIRETLNTRSNYLVSQQQNFLEEIEKFKSESILEKNKELILCKDKIIESKVNMNNSNLSSSQGQKSILNNIPNAKIFEMVDEKIENFENLKNNLAQYEDFIKYKNSDINNNNNVNLTEDLLNENFILKSKNIRLRDFLIKLVKNKNFDSDLENSNELFEIINTNKDVAFSEDLLNMMKAQALMLENILIAI